MQRPSAVGDPLESLDGIADPQRERLDQRFAPTHHGHEDGARDEVDGVVLPQVHESQSERRRVCPP